MQTTIEKKVIILCLLALLVGFAYVMEPFLMAMILAATVVGLFFPLFDRIKKRFKNKGRLASFLTTLIIFLMIILPSTWVVATLINQVYDIVGGLDLKATFANFFTTDLYSHYIEPWVANFETRFQIKVNLLGVLTNTGKQVALSITAYSPNVLFGTANFLFGFLIMFFGVYFLFLEGPAVLKLVMEICPLNDSHERRLIDRINQTIRATVLGYIVTGAVQGILAAAVFAIVGLNAFVVLGVLTFFMSMVPIVGAMAVWLPTCVWLFLQGQIWQGVTVLIGGVALISAIDNFLKPLIMQGRIKVHPLLIFFSLFGGIKLFGPVGILFGPIITALLIAVIQIYREEYVKSN